MSNCRERIENIARLLQQAEKAYHEGDMQDAVVHLDHALEVDPENAEVLNNLGVLRHQEGRLEEALQHFERAIAADMTYADAALNAALAYAESGRAVDAFAVLIEAMRHNPSDGELLHAFQGLSKKIVAEFSGPSFPEDVMIDLAFDFADSTGVHSDWSLSKEALRLLATNLPEELEGVLEFGSGYSTLFLAELFQFRDKPPKIISFEHQQTYFERLVPLLSPFPYVSLVQANLRQLSDYEFEALFASRHPNRDYRLMGCPVPKELYSETQLRHAFYATKLEEHLQGRIDLVIVDGPNGNGRSIAYPLLRDIVKPPFYCLVDDIGNHPFLDQVARVFEYDTIFRKDSGDHTFAFVKIKSVGSSSGQKVHESLGDGCRATKPVHFETESQLRDLLSEAEEYFSDLTFERKVEILAVAWLLLGETEKAEGAFRQRVSNETRTA